LAVTGQKRSAEVCKKISIACRGIKRSEETREKMRLAKINNKYGVGKRYTHSDETRKKMSESIKRMEENQMTSHEQQEIKTEARRQAIKQFYQSIETLKL
jgi:ribosomal protein L14E/L6E/L27E